jgi:hypothetical protein
MDFTFVQMGLLCNRPFWPGKCIRHVAAVIFVQPDYDYMRGSLLLALGIER